MSRFPLNLSADYTAQNRNPNIRTSETAAPRAPRLWFAPKANPLADRIAALKAA